MHLYVYKQLVVAYNYPLIVLIGTVVSLQLFVDVVRDFIQKY